jgi:hypothetical protein
MFEAGYEPNRRRDAPAMFAALALAWALTWPGSAGAQVHANRSNADEQVHPVEPDTVLSESIDHKRAPEGYSVGNFGIAAALSDNGLEIVKSLLNPPVLGQWLESFRTAALSMAVGGRADFAVLDRYVVFPENLALLRSQSSGLAARVETYSPISAELAEHESIVNFIPAIVVQVQLSNRGDQTQMVNLSYQVSPDKHNSAPILSGTFGVNGTRIAEVHQQFGRSQIWLMAVPELMPGSPHGSPFTMTRVSSANLSLSGSVRLESQQSRSLSFMLGVYDPRGYPARRFSSRQRLQRFLLAGTGGKATSNDTVPLLSTLKRQYSDFVAALPRTGDPELDVYSRWYLSAAVLLTKGISTGEVLTMGYKELNQRDSFWTTGAHLIYWPHLELKMLQESIAYQASNGQIPLTILPVINRQNNIDGNEYFILRVARYYRWYRDKGFLKEALPHVKRAIGYLIALDTEKTGLPRQQSFWADWKDVPGAEGRTYAPHFSLLWLAALKAATFLAAEASDSAYALNLRTLYDQAFERVNRDVSQGGLWDHSRYVDLWKDRRPIAYSLEDQTVGAIFGVISTERLDSIYETMNSANESPFGVRETYPYIAYFGQSYGEGEYHNGGVWPYLNFADAWGRFTNGHAADAERILRKVGYNDLVRFNDFSPSEFLNGNTGVNQGFAVQAWDADFFSAIYFGAFGLQRLSDTEVGIHVNLADGRDFNTLLRLPGEDIILSRTAGEVNVKPISSMRALDVRIIH